MSPLAKEHGAINLGQGFPDIDGPEDVSASPPRRSSRPQPVPADARRAGAPQGRRRGQRRFYGLEVDWQSEVLVTSGATEALSDCLAALIEPGDEVVLIEPLYDCYLPLVLRARRDAALRAGDAARLAARREMRSPPRSPQDQGDPPQQADEPGRQSLHRDELAMIAELVIRHDASPSATRSTSTSCSTGARTSR